MSVGRLEWKGARGREATPLGLLLAVLLVALGILVVVHQVRRKLMMARGRGEGGGRSGVGEVGAIGQMGIEGKSHVGVEGARGQEGLRP